MIPKCFKLLRNGKSQIAGIYIRYAGFCGKSRPVYIGQTDNIFGSRPTRTNDPAAGEYMDIKLLESVSNRRRREEYEASLIIKLEPLKQRIYENLFMYKKYFFIAKKANLLRKEIKHDRLKKIIDFTIYDKTLKKLNCLNEKVHKINNIYDEYFNSFCSNKNFKEWKKPGKKYFGTVLNNEKWASDLLFINYFIKELNELENYINKKQENLNKFRRYTHAVRQLLRIKTKDFHPGKYGKYVEIDPFNFFHDIKTIFTESFFFKYAYDFKNYLEKELNNTPIEKRKHPYETSTIYKIAIKYCIKNKDKIISEIIATREQSIDVKKIKKNSKEENELAEKFFGYIYETKKPDSETIYHVGLKKWVERNSREGIEAEDIQAERSYRTWLKENNYEME